MTLADYRSQGRRTRFPIVEVLSAIALIVAAVLFGMELVDYSGQSDSLGSDVTIGGVQVGGLSESDRVARLESVYVEQPVTLRYNGNPILLYPSEVGFRLDTDGMQAAATSQANNEDSFWEGFWNFLWRKGKPAIEVDLQADYSEAELRDYLQDLANRYDAPTEGPGFDISTLTFSGSGGNTRLNIDNAVPLIASALLESNAERRFVELPTETVAGQDATMDTLRQALIDYMESQGVFYNGTTTVVSMFVMDLKTGEEVGIQENLQQSGVSTIKLGVLINYFRHKITAPTDDEKFLLASAVICSANSAANTLMQITSEDSSFSGGPRATTQTMCELGAGNSAILSNLFVGTPEFLSSQGLTGFYNSAGITPCPVADAPVDQTARPGLDPLNYTTAADMGTMLMLTYDCAVNNSGLRTMFPDEITQTECQQILEILRGTYFIRLAELGIPEDVRIVHKVGYGNETVGDIGIVYSPATDYAFAIYIWEEDLDFDGITELDKWDLIEDLSRLIYNYFNPTQPLLQNRQPVNPNGGAACVLPRSGSDVNLSDINQGRFDENMDPLPSACYDWQNNDCRPFDDWGKNRQ